MNLLFDQVSTTSNWTVVLWILLGIVIGFIIGFIVARTVFKNQLKKNPPINEKMVRAMFMQMGRKPSESQIKAVMAQVNSQYR